MIAATLPIAAIGMWELVLLPVGVFIGAVIVRLATKIAAGFTPPFGTAFLTALLIGVCTECINLVFGSSPILLVAFCFFADAALYHRLLKHPETGRIRFGEACWITLAQCAITLGIIIGFYVIAILFYPIKR